MEIGRKYTELSGKRFGKLLVLRRVNRTEDGDHAPIWECKCDCGNMTKVKSGNLMNGKTNSCGCIRRESTSELGRSRRVYSEAEKRLRSIWTDMLRRCEKPSNKDFRNYGARGIVVCNEWHSFDTFKEWSFENGYASSLSIDRVDVNGNYSPSNCKWATVTEQANNKRNTQFVNYNGEKISVANLSREKGVSYPTLLSRIKAGWDVETAVSKPVRGGRHE